MSDYWLEWSNIQARNQMELPTVIAHEPPTLQEDTHKPAGVRLAKMLGQYEARPSSELWSGIQRLAREILKS